MLLDMVFLIQYFEFRILSGNRASGRRGRQSAVLNASRAQEPVSDLLNYASLTLHHEHFQAVVFIQMNVHGRDDLLVVSMLQGGEDFGEFVDIMAVHQGDRAHGFLVGQFPFLLNEARPYQVPDRFGAVFVTHILDQPVKRL